MDPLMVRVEDFIKENDLLRPGDGVVIGLSGGPDSVCLLLMLCLLRQRYDLRLFPVHVHHGLRGAEADQDRDFCLELCGRQGLDCRVFEGDVRSMARDMHLSEEEAGRTFRYQCFETAAEQAGACRIAVAHHLDDQCETVLLNLFRGSSLAGLAGMPVKRGRVVRPLLCLSRGQILDWLKAGGYSWRSDRTNNEAVYTRNRIRLQLLPFLKEEINPRADRHILQAAQDAGQAQDLIESLAARAYEEAAGQEEGRILLDAVRTADLHPALKKEVLYLALTKCAGGRKDIGRTGVLDLMDLLEGESGRSRDLPGGVRAVKSGGRLILQRRDGQDGSDGQDGDWFCPVPDTFPCSLALPGGGRMTFHLFSAPRQVQISKKKYTKWVDYDRIKCRLAVRNRREGDFMAISGGGHKKLKRIFIDGKIPAGERDCMPLLADGRHIIWAAGTGRISEEYKVTERTGRILQVRMEGESYGREDTCTDP